MTKYCYIVAEGPHDIEFLIQLLKSYGLKRITRLTKVDSFWKKLVPTTFPINDDLMKRVPVPAFLQNNEVSVALHSANGITNISKTIEESFASILSSQIFGVGIFLDADDTQSPKQRFELMTSELSNRNLPFPDVLGEVVQSSPRCEVFIAPNNRDEGTLENLLLECANKNYPDLLNLATSYITAINAGQLTDKDVEEFKKPAGQNKAIISSISSILKPSKSLQVTLQDNRWIDENTMALDSIRGVKKFLENVTGLSVKH
jgi:hypothetical protein